MAVVVLNKQVLSYRSANYWLLLLSIDLGTFKTFYDVSSTRGLYLSPFESHVFFPGTAMAPHHPQPTTPVKALERLSKMVGIRLAIEEFMN